MVLSLIIGRGRSRSVSGLEISRFGKTLITQSKTYFKGGRYADWVFVVICNDAIMKTICAVSFFGWVN